MQRAILLRNARRCHYDVLGVAPSASTEDIKRAFREAAKKSHPDTSAGSTAAPRFNLLVEAYRILRDPRKRSNYDAERRGGGAAGWSRRPWDGTKPRGPRETMDQTLNEESRAYMYGHSSKRHGPHGFSSSGSTAQAEGYADQAAGGILTAFMNERGAVCIVLCGLAGMFYMNGSTQRNGPEDYPSQRPRARRSELAATGEKVLAKAGASAGAAASVSMQPALGSGSSVLETSVEHADELVRAFYDPFSSTWQRIPDGFQAPGALDLTAWHKKRTDSVEWSRLFAEGTLSEICPRGGLKVRYRPRWDTFEPVLLGDPVTGKTILSATRPPADAQAESAAVCEVKF